MEAGNVGGKGAGKGVVSQPLAIAALRVVLEAGEGRELADANARITALEAQLEVAQRALVTSYEAMDEVQGILAEVEGTILEAAGGWDPVGARVIMPRQEFLEIWFRLNFAEHVLRFIG